MLVCQFEELPFPYHSAPKLQQALILLLQLLLLVVPLLCRVQQLLQLIPCQPSPPLTSADVPEVLLLYQELLPVEPGVLPILIQDQAQLILILIQMQTAAPTQA